MDNKQHLKLVYVNNRELQIIVNDRPCEPAKLTFTSIPSELSIKLIAATWILRDARELRNRLGFYSESVDSVYSAELNKLVEHIKNDLRDIALRELTDWKVTIIESTTYSN